MVAMLMPASITLSKGNIGIAEGVALVIGLITIDNDPTLLPLYAKHRVDFHIDNMEMLWMFRRRRVSTSEHRLVKIAMLQCLQHFEIKWQMDTTFHYVRSADNPADEPSRDRNRAEQRLKGSVRQQLWREHGPFNLDWMASHTTAMLDGDKQRLPYYSRDADPYSQGINVFANNVHETPEGDRIHGYCYPPFVMMNAVTLYAEAEMAKVLLVHPRIYEPKPLWARRLSRFVTRALPVASGERRNNIGWAPIVDLELEYTLADWSPS
jgi:hypothetical protein